MDPSKSKQTESNAPPNSRASNQLQIKHDGRKPLFGSSSNSQDGAGAGANGKGKVISGQPSASGAVRPPGAGPNGSSQQSSRRTSSESRLPSVSASSNGSGSPGAKRAPRPSSATAASHRRPLSLAQAFKIAESEENIQSDGEDDQIQPMDGSPSPAPRPWRTRPIIDQNAIRQQLGKDHLDTKGSGDSGKGKINKDGSARDDGKASSSSEGTSWRDRADWRARLSTGNEAQNQPPAIDDPVNEVADIPALVPGIDDIPLPSVESPMVGFGFQIEDDFTAGDLQVSDSPRIRMDNRPFANLANRLPFDESSNIDINSRTRVNNPGSKNTRLDEVRNREVRTGSNVPVGLSPSKPNKPKVDGIRDLEVEIESKIPIPDRSLTTTRNSKIDSILHREANPLSNRQIAQNRLADIKEQNAMSRDMSPEKKRLPSSRPLPSASVQAGSVSTEMKAESPVKSPVRSSYGAGGTRIPDTPVTVYKNRRERETSGGSANGKNDYSERQKGDRNGLSESKNTSAATRGLQQGLLQKLARATSASPGPEPEPETRRGALGRRADRGLANTSSTAAARRMNRAITSDNVGSRARAHTRGANDSEEKPLKPTVGFAGLRRVRSTESTRSKRSSLHSEGDPVDRIEAEAKLFALTDNHSERGPSPLPDDKDSDGDGGLEATPRPRKDDPLTMPTPKIVGAYVETPAPALDKISDIKFELPLKAPFEVQNKSKHDLGRGVGSRDTASDPGTSDTEQINIKRAPPPRRRAHSLPRARPPPKNSAQPPSVKDDVKELRRVNNIEDSTIDDFDDMLAGHPKLTDVVGEALNDVPSASDSPEDNAFESKMEQSLAEQQTKSEQKMSEDSPQDQGKDEAIDSDLAAYERMTKSLTTSLYGIHDARKGIERLGDSLSNKQHKELQVPEPTDLPLKKEHESHEHESHKHEGHSHCAQCASHPNPNTVAYVHIPVPRLFSRKPHFRLTLLGLVTLVLSLWCALESSMCAMYCSPTSCSSPPCTWSYDDPSFGVALPVKIDQWVTGGTGRVLFNHAAEEFKDWFADVLDAAYGRDIRDVNLASLSFEGRRSHRRRLRKKGIDNATQHLGRAPAAVHGQWDDLDDDYDYTSIGGDKRVG